MTKQPEDNKTIDMFNIAPIMGNLTMEQRLYEQARASVWKGQHLGLYQAPETPLKVKPT